MRYLSKEPIVFGSFNEESWERIFGNAEQKSKATQIHELGSEQPGECCKGGNCSGKSTGVCECRQGLEISRGEG